MDGNQIPGMEGLWKPSHGVPSLPATPSLEGMA